MDNNTVLFAFRKHVRVCSKSELRTKELLSTLLAVYASISALSGLGFLIIPLGLLVYMCYDAEKQKWFEDSNVKFTNTLFLLSNFCGVIVTEAVLVGIISLL